MLCFDLYRCTTSLFFICCSCSYYSYVYFSTVFSDENTQICSTCIKTQWFQCLLNDVLQHLGDSISSYWDFFNLHTSFPLQVWYCSGCIMYTYSSSMPFKMSQFPFACCSVLHMQSAFELRSIVWWVRTFDCSRSHVLRKLAAIDRPFRDKYNFY